MFPFDAFCKWLCKIHTRKFERERWRPSWYGVGCGKRLQCGFKGQKWGLKQNSFVNWTKEKPKHKHWQEKTHPDDHWNMQAQCQSSCLVKKAFPAHVHCIPSSSFNEFLIISPLPGHFRCRIAQTKLFLVILAGFYNINNTISSIKIKI